MLDIPANRIYRIVEHLRIVECLCLTIFTKRGLDGTRISIIMYIHIYNSFVKVWWYHLCRYRYYCSVSCSTDKQTISISSRSNFAWLMTKHNKIQTVSVIPTKTSQGYKWCWGQLDMVPDQTCSSCLTTIIFYNSFLRYCYNWVF